MGPVNSRRERGLPETNFGRAAPWRGQQPPGREWRNSWAFADRSAHRESVAQRCLGGGTGTVVKPSSVIGLRGSRAPSWHARRGWSSGRGHSSVRGRRVRPPQVGVRRGPGASISEAARLPIERARPVAAEGLSMSPLPRVPAGRFRRSGTRDCAGIAGCSSGSPLRRASPGHRSDRRRTASGREGVKAGEAPGPAGTGLDTRAPRCSSLIIGSPPRSGLLRSRRRLAHPAPAANESRYHPTTSGA
jgi:hypothetical protein